MKIDWMARAAAEIAHTGLAVATKTPEKHLSPVSPVTAKPISEKRISSTAPAALVVPDANRWSWPHGPAANIAELMVMEKRLDLFARRRIPINQAERLADRLLIRDRDGDDRVLCVECRHSREARCPAGRPLPSDVLHQCNHRKLTG